MPLLAGKLSHSGIILGGSPKDEVFEPTGKKEDFTEVIAALRKHHNVKVTPDWSTLRQKTLLRDHDGPLGFSRDYGMILRVAVGAGTLLTDTSRDTELECGDWVYFPPDTAFRVKGPNRSNGRSAIALVTLRRR